ncbi:uncharacterized protein NEMAJ01_0628 [Nematocida major]|uniref:uncharacterized protein n=1 Tax=Nematocida major TaxID=1912982 RepID=UPI0020085171|nr:uncharacterized protein NEMAJ01_0628 [Nematocida major]KAH9385732.1 hypothetical protein NEMAJ01_0628 [Nematocida major]
MNKRQDNVLINIGVDKFAKELEETRISIPCATDPYKLISQVYYNVENNCEIVVAGGASEKRKKKLTRALHARIYEFLHQKCLTFSHSYYKSIEKGSKKNIARRVLQKKRGQLVHRIDQNNQELEEVPLISLELDGFMKMLADLPEKNTHCPRPCRVSV